MGTPSVVGDGRGGDHTDSKANNLHVCNPLYIMYINEEVSKGWMDDLMQAGVVLRCNKNNT